MELTKKYQMGKKVQAFLFKTNIYFRSVFIRPKHSPSTFPFSLLNAETFDKMIIAKFFSVSKVIKEVYPPVPRCAKSNYHLFQF